MKKQIEEQKEELKKKDEQLSQLSSAQETSEPTDKSSTDIVTSNAEDDDKQYVNIDTSSGDVIDKKENTKDNEKCGGPEDYTADYVNVPVDNDNVEKEAKHEVKNEEQNEEADEVSEFDHVVKTETLSSTSQLTRAKVSTLLKRKPPSRGLVRRTAEEIGSQENLFEVDDPTADNDYVNMPINKAVIQQPAQKAEDSSESQPNKKEDDVKDNENDDKVITICFVTKFTCISYRKLNMRMISPRWLLMRISHQWRAKR